MKKGNKILIVISILLIIIGLCFIFKNEIRNKIIYPLIYENVQKEASDVSKKEIQKNKKRNIHPIYDPKVVTSLDYLPKNPEIRKSYLNGYLYVPDVELSIPVLEGIDNKNMAVASGTMKKGQVMGKGNYAIAGHHMANPDILFSPVRRIQQGHTLFLTDKDKIYQYDVIKTFVVYYNNGDVIKDIKGQKLITLVTCDESFSEYRYIVRGKLKKVYPYNKQPEQLKNFLQK